MTKMLLSLLASDTSSHPHTGQTLRIGSSMAQHIEVVRQQPAKARGRAVVELRADKPGQYASPHDPQA